MAEEKQESKPETKHGDKGALPEKADPFIQIISTIFGFFVVLYIINNIISVISPILLGKTQDSRINGFLLFLVSTLFYLKIFIFILSVLSIAGIIYLYRELVKLRLIERKLLYPEIEDKVSEINSHWQSVLNHIESINDNDWRLAILEADIMLSGLLDNLFLPGDTMGDKLKAVEKSDFTTVDNAWEAHKIRNQIAHDGLSFILNQHEARRVIELYRTVFEEFHII